MNELQVKQVYAAFRQQGGTIHQLVAKAIKSRFLTEHIITDYLIRLMASDNARYFTQETETIANHVKLEG